MDKPTSVEDYFAGLTAEQRKALGKLREQIRAAAPEATEAIYYSMPSFRYQGKALVSYAAFKDHLSLFPLSVAAIESLRKELQPYRTSKGTLQFTIEKPMPIAVLKKIVKARMTEIDAKRAKKS